LTHKELMHQPEQRTALVDGRLVAGRIGQKGHFGGKKKTEMSPKTVRPEGNITKKRQEAASSWQSVGDATAEGVTNSRCEKERFKTLKRKGLRRLKPAGEGSCAYHTFTFRVQIGPEKAWADRGWRTARWKERTHGGGAAYAPNSSDVSPEECGAKEKKGRLKLLTGD